MYEWKRGVKLKGEDGKTPVEGVDFVIPEPMKGEDGKTPIKGTDYFTDDEISSFKESVTPVKGRDYFDGADGSPDTGNDIVNKISKLKGDDRLSFDVLKDTPTFQQLRKDISSRDYDLVELKDVSITSPSNGQVLKYNSSTNIWENGVDSSGAPGGADTQVQFNDGGAFGVDADFTYNKTTNTLAISGGILSVNEIVDATWSGDLITLGKGGTGQNLNDPNADSIMGWDDTDGSVGFWSLGNGLIYDHQSHTMGVDDLFVKIEGDTMDGDLVGTDFVKTRSGTITRTGDYISSIEKTGGRTVTITRDADNFITSANDGTRSWTFTRNGSNQITSWSVA